MEVTKEGDDFSWDPTECEVEVVCYAHDDDKADNEEVWQ